MACNSYAQIIPQHSRDPLVDPKDLIFSVWAGITYSVPDNPDDSWHVAYNDIHHYYEATFSALLPTGLVLGATSDSPFHSIDPSPLGQAVIAVPSIRSLYSPFQCLQIGGTRADGTTYLAVTNDLVTVRPFTQMRDAQHAIQQVVHFILELPIWLLRGWWRCTLNAGLDEEHEQLGDCEAEFKILLGVLTARVVSENQPNQQQDYMDLLSRVRQQCTGLTVSTIRLADLLVMCFTGSWGRNPEQVGKCAGKAHQEGGPGHPGREPQTHLQGGSAQ